MSRLGGSTYDIEAHSSASLHTLSLPNQEVTRYKREAAEPEIPEELLVVQSIKISDKFGFRSSQVQSREGAANNLEKDLNSVVSSSPITTSTCNAPE